MRASPRLAGQKITLVYARSWRASFYGPVSRRRIAVTPRRTSVYHKVLVCIPRTVRRSRVIAKWGWNVYAFHFPQLPGGHISA